MLDIQDVCCIFEGCCPYLGQVIRAESRFYVRYTAAIRYYDFLYYPYIIYFR
jgi:hypothetical protein